MVNFESGYIEITKRCNQRCRFCSREVLFGRDMTINEFKDILAQMKKSGIEMIFFTGGEPTLNKNILEMIKLTKSQNIIPRMITNGIRLSNMNFAKKIKDAGIENITISIHTTRKETIEKFDNKYEDNKHVLEGIKNCIELNIPLNYSIVITSANCDYLSEHVEFLARNFPEIRHFSFNFIDVVGQAKKNVNMVPKLTDIELELNKSLLFLKASGMTFRVERVPLCYMRGFEEFSSETERIVKNNEVLVFSLIDFENNDMQKLYNCDYYSNFYVKSEACKFCSFISICAGVKKYYADLHKTNELYPIFESPKAIIKRIMNEPV